ncbi:MAG TPA: GGDEF domain-containing protein, partial [Treponema sp.]|nr:GGDEF domain-containing protein [Treponema sp.]
FLKNLKRNNIPIQFIEINLSPVQCLHPNLPEKILQIVKKHNLIPQELCFEITETAANRSPSIIKTNLDTLARAGFLIAIDDFGTG